MITATQCWNKLEKLMSLQQTAEALKDWSYADMIIEDINRLKDTMTKNGIPHNDPLTLVLAGQ